jgi:hypothetical protein
LLGTLLLEQHVLDLAKLLCEPGPQPRKNIRVSDALDLVREDDVVDGKPWPAVSAIVQGKPCLCSSTNNIGDHLHSARCSFELGPAHRAVKGRADASFAEAQRQAASGAAISVLPYPRRAQDDANVWVRLEQ